MCCEFLKKDEVVLDCEFVFEFDDIFMLEKKGSKKVVWRFMNCWWKVGGVLGNFLWLGVWIIIYVGRLKGYFIEEDEFLEVFGMGVLFCIFNFMMNILFSRLIFYVFILILISVFGYYLINLWEVILYFLCRVCKSELRFFENKCLCSKESCWENKGFFNKWWV